MCEIGRIKKLALNLKGKQAKSRLVVDEWFPTWMAASRLQPLVSDQWTSTIDPLETFPTVRRKLQIGEGICNIIMI